MIFTRRIVAVLFAILFPMLLLTSVVIAQPDDNTDTASASQIPDAGIPQVVDIQTLDNGVQLIQQNVLPAHHVAVLVLLKSGDRNDPKDLAGFNHLMMRLIATCKTGDGEDVIQSAQSLDAAYPNGWSAQSFPDHAVLGWVVPASEVEAVVQQAVDRLATLIVTRDDISRETEFISDELKQRFETQQHLVPASWLVAKSFRHVSDPPRGISANVLSRLTADRVYEEMATRVHPSQISVLLCGDLSNQEIITNVTQMLSTLEDARGNKAGSVELPITMKPTGAVAREIVVEHLQGDKDHGVATFYAPPITAPDHPAFMVVARKLVRSAKNLDGAQARLPFQYSVLVDPRAAYLTPHAWRFPKGPAQALGYWTVKIDKLQFGRTDGKKALSGIAWQLGDTLPPAIIERAIRQPNILYSVAYATAFRLRYGDNVFWNTYRTQMTAQNAKQLKAARQKYFSADNRALFVLHAKQ